MFGPGLARSKSFASQNDVPKELSLFHYNTTIIDLKPFDAFTQVESQQENYNYNDLYADFYPKNELFHLNANNQLVVNGGQNQAKKYLINRNMNFFEPVKDAEMLVHLKSLRTKLKDPNSKETITIKIADEEKKEPLKHAKSCLPRKKPQYESMLSAKSKTTLACSTMDEDKTKALVDDYLNSSCKITNSSKYKNDRPKTDNSNSLDAHLSSNERARYNINKNGNYDNDGDNYSLKSYNLSSFVTDKRGVKSPECNLAYYVNQTGGGVANNSTTELCKCDGKFFSVWRYTMNFYKMYFKAEKYFG